MSNVMKGDMVPLKTFPHIINWQFAFLLLHHMPNPKFVWLLRMKEMLKSWWMFMNLKLRCIFRGWLYLKGRLVILAPNDEGDRDANEDSGDENEFLPKNLNRS